MPDWLLGEVTVLAMPELHGQAIQQPREEHDSIYRMYRVRRVHQKTHGLLPVTNTFGVELTFCFYVSIVSSFGG